MGMSDLKMLCSYHNHTIWSEGKSTLMEMIDCARRAGLEEFGISDHFAIDPDGRRLSWAMDPDFLGDYVNQVQNAKSANQFPRIRLGLEVDYFPETIALTGQRLACHPFDYLIGSVHFVDGFAIDLDPRPWEEMRQESRDGIWRSYWQRLRAAAETKLFDIVGHFDLPKKFGYYPSVDMTEDALAALDAIADADMVIEINGAGWDKAVQEAYPSLIYLHEAKRRGIPLIISADAHIADNVARHFDRACRLAIAAGYTEIVRFERRQRFAARF
jgi:histidinol-phosphatase (PHP family)